MAVDIKTVKQTAKRYADDVRRSDLPIDKAMLFGSYANGTATELSDVDVCFFLKNFGDKNRFDITLQLLKMSRKYPGVFFEPMAFESAEIERDNPFIEEILRTGQEI
jgi:predicted nucleotidyltransferase